MASTATVSLPADLAPPLRELALQLVEQVGLADPPPTGPLEGGGSEHRCWVCRAKGGKLGGHHLPSGRVTWVHPGCHRRLHRRRTRTGRACR